MAETRLQKLTQRLIDHTYSPYKSGHEDKMNALMREFVQLQAKGLHECERCNLWAEALSEPIAMPVSGIFRRVCPACMAEIKQKTPIYTKR